MQSSTVKQPLHVARWLGVAYFVLGGFASLGIGFHIGALLLSALGILVCAPSLKRWVGRHLRLDLQGFALMLVCGVLAVWQINVIMGMVDAALANTKAASAALEQKNQDKAATKVAVDRAYFEANRANVLAEIDAKTRQGLFEEARALAVRYEKGGADADLRKARFAASAGAARLELKSNKVLPLERRASLYTTLAAAEPGNSAYQAKAKALASELKTVRDKEAAVAARLAKAAVRGKMLEAQFSKWDGSHSALEAQIQRTMKNPDSYKHVETRYIDTGKGMRVTSVFRGTNSFGAVVPSRVVAQIDDDGHVLSLQYAD